MAKKKKSSSNDNKTKKSSNGFFKKVISSFLLIILIGLFASIYIAYNNIYKHNLIVKDGGKLYFYIKTGSNFNDVLKSLKQEKIIRNEMIFEWLAKQKNYTNKVKPGRYAFKEGMSNNDIINLLRSGEQAPVELTFNNIRTKNELVRKICSQLEADSTELFEIITNDNVLDSLGFDSENILTMFIPNTYSLNWNTTSRAFMKEMNKVHKKFWNIDRRKKAQNHHITPIEVSIIASIVDKESNNKSERPIIASVYLNRLKKGMLLQADPTVIYALGDFSINRVLSKHLEFDNPYNTYKYSGLPPGPICVASINSIDAVLNSPKTNYIYFCAKEDFSGSHNFASNLNDHNRNASKFQKALNKRKIFS